MNYLQLFQATARKAGIAEQLTTVSPTGEDKRLLEYIDEAWLEVQGLHNNWNFMWSRGSFATEASVKDYDPGNTTVSWINPDSMTLYEDDESDEERVRFVKYMEYRRRFDVGTYTSQKPLRFTLLPNRYIRFHPTPDDVYTCQFDYYKRPSSLSGDTDEPEIPNADLHWIIVQGALRRYAQYEEAADVFNTAQMEFNNLLARLRREELPLMDVQIRPHA